MSSKYLSASRSDVSLRSPKHGPGVSIASSPSKLGAPRECVLQEQSQLTSQVSAVLQVVDALPAIAFAHLLAHEPRHHELDPLFTDNGILRLLDSLVVLVGDAMETGRDRGLLLEKRFRLGDGHGEMRVAGE